MMHLAAAVLALLVATTEVTATAPPLTIVLRQDADALLTIDAATRAIKTALHDVLLRQTYAGRVQLAVVTPLANATGVAKHVRGSLAKALQQRTKRTHAAAQLLGVVEHSHAISAGAHSAAWPMTAVALWTVGERFESTRLAAQYDAALLARSPHCSAAVAVLSDVPHPSRSLLAVASGSGSASAHVSLGEAARFVRRWSSGRSGNGDSATDFCVTSVLGAATTGAGGKQRRAAPATAPRRAVATQTARWLAARQEEGDDSPYVTTTTRPAGTPTFQSDENPDNEPPLSEPDACEVTELLGVAGSLGTALGTFTHSWSLGALPGETCCNNAAVLPPATFPVLCAGSVGGPAVRFDSSPGTPFASRPDVGDGYTITLDDVAVSIQMRFVDVNDDMNFTFTARLDGAVVGSVNDVRAPYDVFFAPGAAFNELSVETNSQGRNAAFSPFCASEIFVSYRDTVGCPLTGER